VASDPSGISTTILNEAPYLMNNNSQYSFPLALLKKGSKKKKKKNHQWSHSLDVGSLGLGASGSTITY
jgi:hypothetical protein